MAILSNFGSLSMKHNFDRLNLKHLFDNDTILVENPFDEELAGKEDRYWANDWISKKNKIIYQPAFEVNHFYTSEGNTWKGIG